MARSTGFNGPSLSSYEERRHDWIHAFARPLSSSAVVFNSVTHGGGLVDSLPGGGRQGSPSSFQQWFIYIFFVLNAMGLLSWHQKIQYRQVMRLFSTPHYLGYVHSLSSLLTLPSSPARVTPTSGKWGTWRGSKPPQ